MLEKSHLCPLPPYLRHPVCCQSTARLLQAQLWSQADLDVTPALLLSSCAVRNRMDRGGPDTQKRAQRQSATPAGTVSKGCSDEMQTHGAIKQLSCDQGHKRWCRWS